MVECQLPKLDVAGSSPVSRSKKFNQLATHLNNRLHFGSIKDRYITRNAVSSALTASRRRSNDVLVYTFSFTSTVWPI